MLHFLLGISLQTERPPTVEEIERLRKTDDSSEGKKAKNDQI